jgi:cysteinyl-tRNA synthetase
VTQIKAKLTGHNEVELGEAARAILARFDEAVSDDLMIPKALPILEEVIANKQISANERLSLIGAMDTVFGLNLLDMDRTDLRIRPAAATITESEVQALIEQRVLVRASKDYAASDRIRDDLARSGVEVMDGDPMMWDWSIDTGKDRTK